MKTEVSRGKIGFMGVKKRHGVGKRILLYQFGSVQSNGSENGTENRTKPHRFSIGSVRFLIRIKKDDFFLFGLD
jgi:hypothetical protein